MPAFDAKVYMRIEIEPDGPVVDCRVVRGGYEYAHEDLDTFFYLNPEAPLSGRQRRMPVGSVITLMTRLTLHHTQDYWGEHDFDVELVDLRVLRARAPTRKQQRRDAFRERSYIADNPAQ